MKTMPAARTAETAKAEEFEQLKRRIHSKLVDKLDLNRVGELEGDVLRREIRLVVEHLCDTEDTLAQSQRARAADRRSARRNVRPRPARDAAQGPDDQRHPDQRPEEHLRRTPRQDGKDARSQFRDNAHLLQIIDRIVSKVGRRVDEVCPMVDARLHRRLPRERDHSAAGPRRGRAFRFAASARNPLKLEDLLNYKAFTPEMVMLLEGAIKARLNIIISGGTGSGKTTLLNTLSSFIPNHDRIVTIEDAAELQLQQDHVVRLETRPPNIEGKGAITATDLVHNALRMRPERIIIGECRGPETLDMLQAMNTGHEGSLTTIHANTPRDAVARIETMITMAGFDLPLKAMRQQIASAVDLIIQANRLQGGIRRKITHITEVVRHGAGHDRDAGHLPVRAGRHRRERPGRRPLRGHRHPPDVHGPSWKRPACGCRPAPSGNA